jgi:hypothetical protein
MTGTRPRLLAVLATLTLALVAGGCGNKEDAITKADTEGPYVTVGHLKYQVQLSRQLNPQDVEDSDYFRGVPADELKLEPNQTWFGVFLSVFNQSKHTSYPSANTFAIEDTLKQEYEPIPIDPALNAFAYKSEEVPTEGRVPNTESLPGSNGVGGTLVLFKLTYASLANRPLELHIANLVGDKATIDLDV